MDGIEIDLDLTAPTPDKPAEAPVDEQKQAPISYSDEEILAWSSGN